MNFPIFDQQLEIAEIVSHTESMSRYLEADTNRQTYLAREPKCKLVQYEKDSNPRVFQNQNGGNSIRVRSKAVSGAGTQ
jgi:peptide methionine sulfoxide reductase MsrA